MKMIFLLYLIGALLVSLSCAEALRRKIPMQFTDIFCLCLAWPLFWFLKQADGIVEWYLSEQKIQGGQVDGCDSRAEPEPRIS